MIVSLALPGRALRAAALAAIVIIPARVAAQSVAEHIALGDRDRAALNAQSALRHYEEALKLDPRSYEALWKATGEAVDLSEFNTDEKERERLYGVAEQYARRAVEANPADAEGHFQLARALGRRALSLGKRDQVRYAGDVRSEALAALRIEPTHAGALHVMGMWNYNVMSLSGLTRLFAKTFLGGKVFNSANWDDAQKFMEESVAAEPARIVHHLDLARVYAARDLNDRAREQYEIALRTAPAEFNDRHYLEEARREIQDVR
ncbi:MAG TPA: hypothetical protein VF929_11985 [Gemmatimonadaceae bacterium]